MPPSWHILEYRLHARVGILQGTKPAVQLWYALRALDVEGTGKVIIPTGEIEVQLGKSRTTIWRYLQDRTFFRSYSYGAGLLTVYLHGLRAVCQSLGLDSIGPVGFNQGLTTIQKDSAAIGAQALQQCSMYVAKVACINEGREPSLLDATLIGGASFMSRGVTSSLLGSSYKQGPISQIYAELSIKNTSGIPQPVQLLRKSATVYGASIEGIGRLLRVCSKTISKSLQGTLRIRQAQHMPRWEYLALRFEASENMGKRLDSSGFFSFHEEYGAYRLHTYLYYPYYALCSQKTLKSLVNPVLRGRAAAVGGGDINTRQI